MKLLFIAGICAVLTGCYKTSECINGTVYWRFAGEDLWRKSAPAMECVKEQTK